MAKRASRCSRNNISKVANEINPMDVAVCDVNEGVDYYRLSSDKRLLFAKLKPYRIPGSQLIGNQSIALGMLYYKMKDLM